MPSGPKVFVILRSYCSYLRVLLSVASLFHTVESFVGGSNLVASGTWEICHVLVNNHPVLVSSLFEQRHYCSTASCSFLKAYCVLFSKWCFLHVECYLTCLQVSLWSYNFRIWYQEVLGVESWKGWSGSKVPFPVDSNLWVFRNSLFPCPDTALTLFNVRLVVARWSGAPFFSG